MTFLWNCSCAWKEQGRASRLPTSKPDSWAVLGSSTGFFLFYFTTAPRRGSSQKHLQVAPWLPKRRQDSSLSCTLRAAASLTASDNGAGVVLPPQPGAAAAAGGAVAAEAAAGERAAAAGGRGAAARGGPRALQAAAGAQPARRLPHRQPGALPLGRLKLCLSSGLRVMLPFDVFLLERVVTEMSALLRVCLHIVGVP